MVKKIIKSIISLIIIALIAIFLFIIIHNANLPEISTGLATISKEEIEACNIKFEEFYGINNNEDTKKLLEICKENYVTNLEEPVKIPLVKFVVDNNEIILENDFDRDYTNIEETEYYIGLNNILEKILSNKSYKVEFKYITRIIEGTSLIGEIKITECDDAPRKFDLKDLEENRVYLEEENRDTEKVSIEVKEDSISKSGVTIVVTDKNKRIYTWDDIYTIEQKIDGNLEKVKSIKKDKKDYIVNYNVDKNNQIIFEIDWTPYYGELSSGIYRIVKLARNNGVDIEFYSNEFMIEEK